MLACMCACVRRVVNVREIDWRQGRKTRARARAAIASRRCRRPHWRPSFGRPHPNNGEPGHAPARPPGRPTWWAKESGMESCGARLCCAAGPPTRILLVSVFFLFSLLADEKNIGEKLFGMGNCLAPAAKADGSESTAAFPEALGAPPGFQQSTHRAIKLLGRGASFLFLLFVRSAPAHPSATTADLPLSPSLTPSIPQTQTRPLQAPTPTPGSSGTSSGPASSPSSSSSARWPAIPYPPSCARPASKPSWGPPPSI
jgi:hypothetical protein